MNKKNYFIAGGVALIVLVAGYFLLSGSKQYQSTQTPVGPTEEIVASPTVVMPSEVVPTESTSGAKVTKNTTIDYTDSGFAPKSITVKVGTAVVWTNKTNSPMWVASAPHPSHTDLAGFDQLKSVNNGGTYSYTFTKVGNWKYHNHMAPSDT
ncbi:hypothetical protein HY945_04010, partial [Candidatus Gottesmanbacteria bacterium]|nr:hypothetical protein [Candidatus Gottesmanbacteria bacterium]